jgi:hypothetical protein
LEAIRGKAGCKQSNVAAGLEQDLRFSIDKNMRLFYSKSFIFNGLVVCELGNESLSTPPFQG